MVVVGLGVGSVGAVAGGIVKVGGCAVGCIGGAMGDSFTFVQR